MIRTTITFVGLLVLVGFAVKWVAPTFMPDTPSILPDTSAIDQARAVVGQATKNYEKATGVTVDLSGKGLTAVPPETFTLTDATTLDLSQNVLSGSLPAEVRHLAKLETLDLSNNNFTGVPAEIGQLQNLKVLDLSNNPITGLPMELANLKKLQKLDLSGTSYSKRDLEEIMKGLPEDVLVVRD